MAGSKNIDFIPKGNAIGLPFSQKMAGSMCIDFLTNSKVIGLPFSQKNGSFQEY